MGALHMIQFGADDVEKALAGLSAEELDELPFGAILLDGAGAIIAYNAPEGAISGRDPRSVIGANFFEDIAPCTDASGFRDRFESGVARGDLNVLMEWTFSQSKPVTRVLVHMKRAAALRDRYWIFVKRAAADGRI